MKRSRTALLLAGVVSVVALALGAAAPAIASTANGRITCGYVYAPHLRIESSTMGGGSWQNRNTGAVATYEFYAGTTVRITGWQNVNWVVNNNAHGGYFYSAPYGWCG